MMSIESGSVASENMSHQDWVRMMMRRKWNCMENDEKKAVQKVMSQVRATATDVVRESGLENEGVLHNWFNGKSHFDREVVLDTRRRVLKWAGYAKENVKKRIKLHETKAAETRAWVVENGLSVRDIAAKTRHVGNLVPFFDFMLGTNMNHPSTVSAAEKVFEFCKRTQLESFGTLTEASWLRWHELVKEEEDIEPYTISEEDLKAVATLDVLNLSNDPRNILSKAGLKRKRDDDDDGNSDAQDKGSSNDAQDTGKNETTMNESTTTMNETTINETKRRKSNDATVICPTSNAAKAVIFNKDSVPTVKIVRIVRSHV